MRLLAFGIATAIVSLLPFDVNAADFASAPPMVGQPQYGVGPNVVAAPPLVIIVPAPTVSPQYDGATVPPPPGGAPPYGVARPMSVAPRAMCPPTWRCGERGCGWQSGCVPPPDRYSVPDRRLGQYESPGPVYPGNASPAPERYPSPYGSLGPQVYSPPDASPAPERYPGPYGSPGPQVYSPPDASPAPEGYPGPYPPQAYPEPGPYSKY
jgi:hypothetical protein